MESILKINVKQVLESKKPVVIDLGCGSKKKADRIGIDQADLPGVDIITDIEAGLPFFPDGSVDHIHCRSVLEHIKNFEFLLKEMIRVLKPDGTLHIFVPHFSNPYFYSDPTHIRPFGLYTFYYFVDTEHQLKRKVPNYYSDIRIQIISQKLIFRSKFAIFGFIKKAIGKLINSCTLFQEYYEENLCYSMPAHGIELVITHPK